MNHLKDENMGNKAFRRAVDCLAHPLAVAAVAMLACNALVLQPRWPSWWTGKIGDVAWLFFVPFLVAALLSWLVPGRPARQERIVGLAALTVTGLAFALVKAVPAVNALAAAGFFQLTGHAAKLALDPTDLLALPALAGAGLLWEKVPRRSAQPFLRGAAVLLAVATTAADAASPYSKGIVCLLEEGDTLVAFEENWEAEGRDFFGPSPDNLHWHSYRSADGGLSWQQDEEVRQDNPCARQTLLTWPIRDRRHRLEYTFVAGKGVYARRYDGSMAPYLSLALPKGIAITGALFHEPSGNVVLTLGPDQILVKPAGEDWRQLLPVPSSALLGRASFYPTQTPKPTLPDFPTMPYHTATVATPTPNPHLIDWVAALPGLTQQRSGLYYLPNLDLPIGVPLSGFPANLDTANPVFGHEPYLYQVIDLFTIVLDSPQPRIVAVVDNASNTIYQYELWTVSAAFYDPASRKLVARQMVIWWEGNSTGVAWGHYSGGGNVSKNPAKKEGVFALLQPGQAVYIQLTVGLSVENQQQILSRYATSPFPGAGVAQDLYFYGILLGADPERHLPDLPCVAAEEIAHWTGGTALPQASVLGIASNIKATHYPTLAPVSPQPTPWPSPHYDATPTPLPTPTAVVTVSWEEAVQRGTDGRYYLKQYADRSGQPLPVGIPSQVQHPTAYYEYQMVTFYTVTRSRPQARSVAVVDRAGNIVHHYNVWTLSVVVFDPASGRLIPRDLIVWGQNGTSYVAVGTIATANGQLIGSTGSATGSRSELLGKLAPGTPIGVRMAYGITFKPGFSWQAQDPFPGTASGEQLLYFYSVVLGGDPERQLETVFRLPSTQAIEDWIAGKKLPSVVIIGDASNPGISYISLFRSQLR